MEAVAEVDVGGQQRGSSAVCRARWPPSPPVVDVRLDTDSRPRAPPVVDGTSTLSRPVVSAGTASSSVTASAVKAVNHEPFLTLGLHIGAKTTSIVATDLFGRTLDVVETPPPRGAQNAALASLAGSARRYLSRWHRRRPLWVGVAAGGVVDSTSGYLDHARLGWTEAPVGPVLAEALGLPVSVASHVDAMAGAELLARRCVALSAQAGTSLPRLRPRDRRLRTVHRRPRALTVQRPGHHRRAAGELRIAGRHRQLESTVSDEAVLNAARAQRIVPAEGPASTLAAVLRAARGGHERRTRAADRTSRGARRGRGAAARHAQPRRPGGRRSGAHRIPRGYGAGRTRASPHAPCWDPAISG